jgi:hypothetical protein
MTESVGQTFHDAGIRPGRRRAAGPGAPPGYDWDMFFVPIMRRIYDHGLPSTQGELLREMLDWFLARHGEQAPDEKKGRVGLARAEALRSGRDIRLTARSEPWSRRSGLAIT